MLKHVNIGELQPGMVITQIVAQNGPVKIRKSGLVSSLEMVQGLAEMGVLEVEIDTAQTVEIEAATVVKSQTQKLLDSKLRSNHDLDHSLSDQFNRSLFLASGQDLPSAWQHYAKQVLLAAIVVLGGGALGWTAATADKWIGVFKDNSSTEVSHYNHLAPVKQQQLAVKPVQGSAMISSPAVQSLQASEHSQTLTSNPAAVPSGAAVSQAVPTEPHPAQPNKQEPVSESVSQPVISPQLLAKFNAAIEQLDKEPKPVQRQEVKVYGDIPRVDQLPTRTMTKLPSLSFSAHMYATIPAERWVRVNGQRYVEGDWITEQLTLLAIEPQHVILAFEGQKFKMAALTDW